MHPRDPARSHGPRVSIVQQPRYREIEMRLAAVPRPISSSRPARPRAFFLNGTGYFIQRHSARAPFDIAVSLHKIQGLHKTALRAPSTRAPDTPDIPEHGRETAVTTVEWDARATIGSRKGFPNAISDQVRQLINVSSNVPSLKRSAVKNLASACFHRCIRYRIKVQFDCYSPYEARSVKSATRSVVTPG